MQRVCIFLYPELHFNTVAVLRKELLYRGVSLTMALVALDSQVKEQVMSLFFHTLVVAYAIRRSDF